MLLVHYLIQGVYNFKHYSQMHYTVVSGISAHGHSICRPALEAYI